MLRRWLLIGYFALLLVLSLLQLRTGLADNGDFERDICPYMTKPVGFDSYSPVDAAEHERRFVHYWYDRWELRPGLYDVKHICQGSSQQLLVMAEVLLSKLFLGTRIYSVTLGSMVPRVLSWLLFAGFCAWFYRLTSRSLSFLVPTTLLWLLFNGSVFAGMLNSFYEDLTGILAFAGVVLFLARYLESQRRRELYAAMACLVMLTAAKTAYILSPFIALACLSLARPPRRDRRVIALGCGLALAAALPMQLRDSNRPLNAYDAVYIGALALLTPAERADLVKPAGPYDEACVGLMFAQDPSCLARNRHLSHADALRIYLTHPRALGRALERLRTQAVPGRVELGMDQPGVHGFAQLPLFNVWSHLLTLASLLFYPLLLAAAITLTLAARRHWRSPSLWLALLLTLTTSLTQYVVMLADGATDFGRHGLLATFSLCLFLTLCTAAHRHRTSSQQSASGSVQ